MYFGITVKDSRPINKNPYEIREWKNIDKIFNRKSDFYYIVKSYSFLIYHKRQKKSLKIFRYQDISCSVLFTINMLVTKWKNNHSEEWAVIYLYCYIVQDCMAFFLISWVLEWIVHRRLKFGSKITIKIQCSLTQT